MPSIPPQLPPPSHLMEPTPRTPVDTGLAALQQRRSELLQVVADSLTPANLQKVLNALLVAATGGHGPNQVVAAAKLYLQYAVGAAENLASAQKSNPLTEVTAEEARRLEGIAARHGVKLTNVRIVKTVPSVGGEDVIETTKPDEETGGS